MTEKLNNQNKSVGITCAFFIHKNLEKDKWAKRQSGARARRIEWEDCKAFRFSFWEQNPCGECFRRNAISNEAAARSHAGIRGDLTNSIAYLG